MTAAARIEEAFDALGAKDADGDPFRAHRFEVPYCDHKGNPKTTTLYEAIKGDLLCPDTEAISAALFKVLEESNCPHVQALRNVMCSQWVRSHADELEAAYDLEAAA
jgi:hypothetical protein